MTQDVVAKVLDDILDMDYTDVSITCDRPGGFYSIDVDCEEMGSEKLHDYAKEKGYALKLNVWGSCVWRVM